MKLENLENICQLHESIKIINIVDGFWAGLYTGDDPDTAVLVCEGFGEDIIQALYALDAEALKMGFSDVRQMRRALHQ